MAVVLNQTPPLIVGLRDPAIYLMYDAANYSLNKFRYLCEVSVYNGSLWTVVALLKRYPNNSNAAVFNISNILLSHQRASNPPLDPAAGMAFGVSDSAVRYRIKFGYEASTSPDTSPTKYWTGTESAIRRAIDARFLGLQNTLISGGIKDNYILDGVTKSMLSLAGTSISVSDTEKGSLSFISNTAAGSDPTNFSIKYFDSTGTIIGAQILLSVSTSGGVDPGSTDRDSIVQYAYVYPAHLEGVTGAKPSTHPGWSYYEVFPYDTGPAVGETVTFHRDNDCRQGTPIKLMWKNRLGGWDQMYSNGHVRRKQDIKRTQLEHDRGNWYSAQGANSFDFLPSNSSIITELTRQSTYTTQFLPETPQERLMCDSLVEARHALAWLYQPNGAVVETLYPIIITTTSVKSLTAQNDKTAVYTIDFKMSNERAI